MNLLIFISLLIFFSPIIVVGYIYATVKGFIVSRKYGLSATALSPLSVRWVMHELGIRSDAALEKMIFNIPSVSEYGLKLCLYPLV